MTALIDNPDDIQYLYRFISDDIMRFVSWQEESGLLVLNNGNDYIGSGSYGFIDDFPVRQDSAAPIKKNELWVNMNSQETICVSPQMFADYIFPHYYNLAGEFGLVYYGCCEPVHNIWDTCIAKLPKLKKVSISPWCDEQFMGDRLRNSKIIYSRKPNPALIGLGNFDQNIFKRHIADTLLAAKECNLEIIFRDIFTLHGSRDLAGRAVNITRELIDELWQK
ncbi:MAG TPA: hypothetical protein DC049_06195 [Spirochaetia bacterium]|nr:hypothetical protein [Spirochaetia bacterium]